MTENVGESRMESRMEGDDKGQEPTGGGVMPTEVDTVKLPHRIEVLSKKMSKIYIPTIIGIAVTAVFTSVFFVFGLVAMFKNMLFISVPKTK